MSTKERLVEYLDFKGITKYRAEAELGWSNKSIANGKNFTAERLGEFVTKYNDVSLEWLLFGTGEMMKPKDTPIIYNETKPRIPYDAAAGTLTDTVNGVTEKDCEQIPVISVFPRYDFTIRITGKSMEPEYYSGDEVACMRINERHFIQWGRVHVLDTTQGVVIKRIYEEGETIRCKSFNPEYPDFFIPKKEIRSYNLVVGSIRL